MYQKCSAIFAMYKDMEYIPLNQYIFAGQKFFKTRSIVERQKIFRPEFQVLRHGRIPTERTISGWISDFRFHGSVGSNITRLVHTHENIEGVRIAAQQSLT